MELLGRGWVEEEEEGLPVGGGEVKGEGGGIMEEYMSNKHA